MFRPRTSVAVVGILAATLTMTACSGGTSSGSNPSASSSTSSSHNSADVSFAMEMSAHHQQAITMSDMILDKSGIDPKVTSLAEEIKAAQSPEIKKMKSWLIEWGEKSGGMSGMDHGGMTMSDSDMNALKESSGVDASKLFLTQMTTHHNGALDMATTEVDKGKNSDALALAKTIITTQTAEITTMSDLLGTL
ncbi:DUF305 domain-containing protein [Glaciihabitans sp. UYNi722]|uniref:DUF305 domain-containing protein n=1 Tax=Glaciihabitans sp. UYNi722 TaxID=3156344 RepID=UPI003397E0DC